MRVTSAKLLKMLERINTRLQPGSDHLTPGYLALEQNINGYQLQMIVNFGGAVHEQSGYLTAREMYNRLRGYEEAFILEEEIKLAWKCAGENAERDERILNQ